MASVGRVDTAPEMAVRRLLHGMGYRYGLHSRDLPGRPDIVFRSRRKVVFVHGCFWHGHECKKGRLPKTRDEYWRPKIGSNKARDEKNLRDLVELGWSVYVVWECETKSVEELSHKLNEFLEDKMTTRY